MKQETLEEVAENYGWSIKRNIFSDPIKANELAESSKQDFIEGAKWQQERSYSEEDMKYAYEQGARLALLSQSPLALHKGEFPNPEEWFNQYKEENNIWK